MYYIGKTKSSTNSTHMSSSYNFVFLTDNSRRPSRRRSGNHGKDALRRRRAAQWAARENPLRRSPRLGGQQTTPERVGVSEPKFTCISIDRCVQHGPGFPDLAGRGANPYRSRIHLLKSFLLYIVFCSCSVSIPVAFFIFVQKFISPLR